MSNIEKHIGDFYNKYTDCKDCKTKRNFKPYCQNKDNLSSQRKLYYEKNSERLLQEQNKR